MVGVQTERVDQALFGSQYEGVVVAARDLCGFEVELIDLQRCQLDAPGRESELAVLIVAAGEDAAGLVEESGVPPAG